MNLKTVQVLTRFDLRGKSYPAGEAQVPEEKVKGLLAKGLISVAGTSSDVPLSGTVLEAQLVDMLTPLSGESLSDETPLATLKRLIFERDDAVRNSNELFNKNSDLAAKNEQLSQDHLQATQLVADMHAAALGEVRGPIRGVVEDVQDLRKRAEDAESRLAELTNQAPSAPTQDALTQNTPPQGPPETGSSTQQPSVFSAEDLATATGNPRAAISLMEAGFNTREKLTAASDDELTKLPQVGDAAVKKLREYLAK